MGDSVKEQIMKAVVARLKQITVTNQYELDVAKVERMLWAGQTQANTPYALALSGADRYDGEGSRFPRTARVFELWIVLVIAEKVPGDPRSADERFIQFGTEVERALMGLRQDSTLFTQILPPDWEEAEIWDNGLLAMAMIFPVHYSHQRHDPRQL